MADINPIPDNYPRLVPYLHVQNAAAAIDYYADVLGAIVRMRLDGPGDKIGHAELEIGDGLFMLADEFPEIDVLAPPSVGGTPVSIQLFVEDVDAVFARAIAAGGTVLREVADQFYGDRAGQFRDPFGHHWSISTHIEDLTHEEIGRRMAALGSDT